MVWLYLKTILWYGELSSKETISFLAINHKVDRFLVSVPDPEDANHNLDIYLTPINSPSITVDTSTASAYIKIKIDLTGQIYSMSENSNYLNPAILDNLSNTCNKYVEANISNYLYKTSKEFHSDINGLGNHALKNFFTTKDFDTYNWLDNYKDAFFDVEVNTSVKSSMLLTET